MFLRSIVQPRRAVLWLAVLLAERFHFQVETSTQCLQVAVVGCSEVLIDPNECSCLPFCSDPGMNQCLAKGEHYSTHHRKTLIPKLGPFSDEFECSSLDLSWV